jgi:hypothetical protein
VKAEGVCARTETAVVAAISKSAASDESECAVRKMRVHFMPGCCLNSDIMKEPPRQVSVGVQLGGEAVHFTTHRCGLERVNSLALTRDALASFLLLTAVEANF